MAQRARLPQTERRRCSPAPPVRRATAPRTSCQLGFRRQRREADEIPAHPVSRVDGVEADGLSLGFVYERRVAREPNGIARIAIEILPGDDHAQLPVEDVEDLVVESCAADRPLVRAEMLEDDDPSSQGFAQLRRDEASNRGVVYEQVDGRLARSSLPRAVLRTVCIRGRWMAILSSTSRGMRRR